MSSGPLKGLSHVEVIEYWNELFDLATTRPEDMEVIAPASEAPPNTDPIIICEINVRPNWEDQSRIQCNVCGNKAKFKNNGHIANYGDGFLYVVGPDCGSEDHVRKLNTAVNEYNASQRLRFADDNIKKFAENYSLYFEDFEFIREHIKAVVSLRKGLNRRHSSIFRKLKNKEFQLNPSVDLYDNDENLVVATFKCPEIFANHYDLYREWMEVSQYLEKHFSLYLRHEDWNATLSESSVPTLSKKLTELKNLIGKFYKSELKLQSHLLYDLSLMNKISPNLIFRMNNYSLFIEYWDYPNWKFDSEKVNDIPLLWFKSEASSPAHPKGPS